MIKARGYESVEGRQSSCRRIFKDTFDFSYPTSLSASTKRLNIGLRQLTTYYIVTRVFDLLSSVSQGFAGPSKPAIRFFSATFLTIPQHELSQLSPQQLSRSFNSPRRFRIAYGMISEAPGQCRVLYHDMRIRVEPCSSW